MMRYLAYILLVVSLLAGGVTGYYIGVESGWDMAREKVYNATGVDDAEEALIDGIVTATRENELLVETRSLDPVVQALSDKDLSVRTVILDHDTQYFKVTRRPPEDLQRPLKSPDANNTNNTDQQSLSAFKEEEAEPEDIEIGDEVVVYPMTSSSGQKEIVANRIDIIKQ